MHGKGHIFLTKTNICSTIYTDRGVLKMSGISFENKPLDVICQHTKEGRMIPLRIRLTDEDRQYQTYSVKEYKEYSNKGEEKVPEGLMATNTIHPFELKILSFGSLRRIRVFYNCSDCTWYLAPEKTI